MSKRYTITAIVKATGEFVTSNTNNVEQRLARLIYNIESINGRGTAVFDRFTKFLGVSVQGVEFKVVDNRAV